MKNIYLLLPGCDDTNRGDQALIWESVSLAREANNAGNYFMLAEEKNSLQSSRHGIKQMGFILPHPSTHFKKNDNIRYGKVLLAKWAIVSMIDSSKAILLLFNSIRKHFLKYFSKDIQKTINLYKRADAVFVKGGGFVHSYGSLANSYANFYDLYHIILAQQMGKDVYFMPNSFGPLKSPGTKRLVKYVLERCKYVSVRESVSYRFLKNELNLSTDLKPDLAFYLPMNDKMNPEQSTKLKAVLSNKKNVAITVRPYRFPDSDNPDKKYIEYKDAICKFVGFLTKSDYHTVLIEHTHSSNTHENDMSCINDIEKKLKKTSYDYSVYSDRTLDCTQLKYVYSCFDYLIGTRFHSVIFSLSSGVPAIAVTYGGNKGEGIMKDIGIDEYTIPINDMSFERLRLLFEKMVTNDDRIKSSINKYLGRLPQEREDLINKIKR